MNKVLTELINITSEMIQRSKDENYEQLAELDQKRHLLGRQIVASDGVDLRLVEEFKVLDNELTTEIEQAHAELKDQIIDQKKRKHVAFKYLS